MNNTDKFNVLGEKPVGRLLMQYAVPAIIAMTASSIYNIVDGIFIGQGVGKEAIMGLALTAPVMSLTSAFGAMVGVGAATLMSVRLGQKDYSTARNILGNVIIMNIVMGLALGFILQLALTPILYFFGASKDTIGPAHDFMTVILAGNVVTHLYLGLNALLRSTNRPQKAMVATFGTVILNCILAPIFIFVLRWGIEGAALATVLAQLFMLFWQIHLFSSKSELIHLSRDIMHPNARIMRESLIIGLPQFLVNLCACLVTIFLTRSMTQYGGDVAVGAYGISNRLVLFIVMVVIGINQGLQPIAGYNYGAGKYDRLVAVVKKAIFAATIVSTAGFLLAQVAAYPFSALFAKGSPDLVDASALGLRVSTIMFPFIGMQIVSGAFFQSIGMPGKSIFLSLSRQLIFLLPALLLLPLVLSDKVLGVWLALPVSDAAASIVSFVMIVAQIRKFKQQYPHCFQSNK